MYINSIGYYTPATILDNEHFLAVNGLTSEWIEQRTGILTRHVAADNDDQHTMGIHAIDNAIEHLSSYDIKDIELIVAASYTPIDTVGTMAHVAQQKYGIEGARALQVTTACTSFVTGLEVIEGYFASGKATKALLVCSEHNTYYGNESDPETGHLWGDAAVAYFVSKEQISDTDFAIKSIYSSGLATLGRGPQGVMLRPRDGGIMMPHGRDVFVFACRYSLKALTEAAKEAGMELNDIDYIICHQGNKRIIMHVAHQCGLPMERFLTNIEHYGNTGSASAPLVLAQNIDKYPRGTKFGVTAFGGGYSCGAFIIVK